MLKGIVCSLAKKMAIQTGDSSLFILLIAFDIILI